MTDEVIVIRKTTGADILALFVKETDTVFEIEHPYYAKYDMEGGNVSMLPYCAFSDEKTFKIRKDNIDFVVPASKEIADKFLMMLNVYDQQLQDMITHMLDEDKELDRLEAAILNKTYMDGNTTKH
jgi:hypothetical protein